MDLYGLNAARAEGNARTENVDLFNEQIKTARDNINNALDREKIQAAGNLRDQQGKDTQDKIFYDIHDAMSGAGIASSIGRLSESVKEFQSLRAAGDTRNFGSVLYSSQRNLARKVNPKLNLQFGEATAAKDEVGEATKNATDAVKEADIEMTPLSTAQQTDIGNAVGTKDFDEARRNLRARLQGGTVEGVGASPAETAFTEGGERATALQFNDARQALAQRIGRNTTPGQGTESTAANNNTGDESTSTSTKPAEDIEDATGDDKTGDDPVTNPKDEGVKDTINAGEELENEGSGFMKDAAGKVSKVAGGLRVLNDVSGGIATYELFKNGLAKNKDGTMDTWKDVSQVANAVGTGLDIVGAFIPALEPLGNIAQAVGAVADTIDTHEKDSQATSDAQADVDDIESKRQAQLSALPSEKPPNPPVNTMVAGGLVGTQAQHINNATQGTGAF